MSKRESKPLDPVAARPEPGFFSEFQLVGELVDSLLLKQPERKLLVDISSDRHEHEEAPYKRHPSRITLTIIDDALIDFIQSEVTTGWIVKASGTFTQSNYIPYRTTFIDTTFLTKKFEIVEKPLRTAGFSRFCATGKVYRPIH